ISDFNKWGDKLSFRDLVDRDDDSDVDLDDLLASVSSIADKGAGKSVVVTFDNGASVVFAKAGTGAVDSLTDLVKDAETQILISSTS
ncbi:MAG TPA: type I secretion C-terminal target domain-containing protein, partial [Kiloniellaceae bacterium]|nr:type I secretion C-terminal target domain-containing protein [Kiloniellaceae bacterium]